MTEKACGGIIVKNNKVLMVNQTKGFIGFPKGHVEDGETEEVTAIREIKEETNVLTKLDTSKRFVINYYPKDNVYKEVVYFIGEAIDDSDIIAQKGEVEEVMWVDIDEVANKLAFDNIKDMWTDVLSYLNKS